LVGGEFLGPMVENSPVDEGWGGVCAREKEGKKEYINHPGCLKFASVHGGNWEKRRKIKGRYSNSGKDLKTNQERSRIDLSSNHPAA